jgi:hypothetical protein
LRQPVSRRTEAAVANRTSLLAVAPPFEFDPPVPNETSALAPSEITAPTPLVIAQGGRSPAAMRTASLPSPRSWAAAPRWRVSVERIGRRERTEKRRDHDVIRLPVSVRAYRAVGKVPCLMLLSAELPLRAEMRRYPVTPNARSPADSGCSLRDPCRSAIRPKTKFSA